MNKRWLLIGLIIFLTIPLFAKKKPDWVKERPIENDYYIGIGIAQKTKGSMDYIQFAKDDALKNLTSEIEIKISSEVVSRVIETSGILEEELKAQIISTTQAELEDYKLVGTWENKKEYWVYYRLARDTYKINRMKKLDKAKSLSLDLFLGAKESEEKSDYTKALTFYLQALKPIEAYITEPLIIEYEGLEVYLNNEIYFSLQNLISGIEINPVSSPIAAKIGKALKQPIEFSANYSEDGQNYMIMNLPLRFEFIKGEGELLTAGRTNSKGLGKTTVSKINSPDKMQIIRTVLDINSLIEADSSSFLFNNIISSLPIPDSKVILNVSGLTIFIESNEKNLGAVENIKHVEPLLKETLAGLGYSFTDDLSAADVYIQLDAETSEGSFMYEMYSVFADANISVTDLNSGEEVYKTSLSKIKGIDLDQTKAGRKALDKCGKTLADSVIPELKKKL